MIGGLVASLVGSAWARATLRYVVTAIAILLFLLTLRRSGEPYELSPGRLVQETLVTSGTMTNRIDRLATKGWVARLPSPTDRRGVIVRLTVEGRDRVDAAMADLLARERELLASMPEAERDALTGALRRLLAPFED